MWVGWKRIGLRGGEERDGDYLRYMTTEVKGCAQQKRVRCLIDIYRLYRGEEHELHIPMSELTLVLESDCRCRNLWRKRRSLDS